MNIGSSCERSRHRGATAWLLSGVLLILTTACQSLLPPCHPVQETAVLPASTVYRGSSDVFAAGPLAVDVVNLLQCEHDAPAPMRIYVPRGDGPFAVIQFQHAFQTLNSFYDDLLTRVAGHGFVVVAAQMYLPGIEPILTVNAEAEAKRAMLVRDWIPARLADVTGVNVAFDRVGLVGHSRGGKVVWIMLRDRSDAALAVAGIDPVDGGGGPIGGQARVINGVFDIEIPTLIIGAGKGTSCSPPGDNFRTFYDASPSPAWLVVADDYGHGDMLDDDVVGLAASLCGGGPDPAAMRRLTAGLLVSFFRATLQGDDAALGQLERADNAPVKVTLESR